MFINKVHVAHSWAGNVSIFGVFPSLHEETVPLLWEREWHRHHNLLTCVNCRWQMQDYSVVSFCRMFLRRTFWLCFCSLVYQLTHPWPPASILKHTYNREHQGKKGEVIWAKTKRIFLLRCSLWEVVKTVVKRPFFTTFLYIHYLKNATLQHV